MKKFNMYEFANEAVNKQYKEFLAKLDKKNYTYVFVQNLMIELKKWHMGCPEYWFQFWYC